MVESSRVRRRREQRVCAKLNARYQYSRETTRRDASLLFLSLNSLSRDWWQNRALKMWWFFVVGKVTKVRWEKKNWQMTPLFFSSVPLLKTTLYYLKRATITKQNTHETRTKRERNKSENDERVFIFYVCVCVCAETVLYYSFHKQGILLSLFSFCANFLVSSHSTSSESRQEANERDSR